MASPVRVGVLSFHDSKESKAICNAIESLGHHPEWLRETNTVIHLRSEGVELTPDVDVVANRLLLSNTDQPAEELGVANAIAAVRPMLNEPSSTAVAAHKIATATRLVAAGIPIPETVLALSASQLNRYRTRFGPEAVYKTAIGTHGGGAWKVDTDELLTARVGRRRAFLQALIGTANERPHDLRVYVVDGSVVGAMYRFAAETEWRTNVARGGSVEDATDSLPEQVGSMACAATEVVGLDYAGVDLIEGDDGWCVLEVNPTAGFKGLYRATGRSPAPYIAKLAVERAGGSVDAERVETLAATLDDSTPSCTPVSNTASFEDPVVIGLTERLAVSGTTGTRTVVASADTGRSRTCIDIQLAADIGADPIRTTEADRRRQPKPRPVVDLVLGIGGTQYTVEAEIVDRREGRYPLVLGRDVLSHYHIDVSRNVEGYYEASVDDE